MTQDVLSSPPFSCVAVIGVGLIGGSFALALRAAGMVEHVVGCGRSIANLKQAETLGVVDRWTTSAAEAVADADLVLLATPVGGLTEILTVIAPHLRPDAIVTDAGSTKQDVVAAARLALGDNIRQFVPGHPIAGAEHSGVAAAKVDLYQNRKVVLTPLATTPEPAVTRVTQAWLACGADVRRMTAANHDRVFAAVSHLPHLLAFALVHELAGREDADLFFDYAASGFRDFTRIASSHPVMWRDICLSNRSALLQELHDYRRELDTLALFLERADGASLEGVFSEARSARNAWVDGTPLLNNAAEQLPGE